MTCRELVELITAYLDGTLDPDTERRFTAHLAMCDGCVNYLEQIRQAVEAVGALPVERLSDESRDGLMKMFRDWQVAT
ncbi:zf-HC2 domain-containing protein [Actinomadura fulvescens]